MADVRALPSCLGVLSVRGVRNEESPVTRQSDGDVEGM